MEIFRKGYFKFDHSFLKNKLIPYWANKGIDLVVETIIDNLSDIETFKYFKPFYEESRKEFYKEFIEKINITEEEKQNKYAFFFSQVESENIMLNLYQKINDRYYKVEQCNYNNYNKNEDSLNNEPYYGVIESTKYKINHPLLNHTFELFGVPNEDPWATINKFHMGPVRGYYDGTEVYLTISAIMSFHTNLSPDYRIMFGSKDPADICNKYRMRGYGVILNKNELAQLITYSENIPFWQKLYKINKKKKNTIIKFLSPKYINDDLFKPRSINADHYTNSTSYVQLDYNNINYKYIDNNFELDDNLNYNYQNNNLINNYLINEIYFKHKFLNLNGKPKPLKRWMIDSAWDLFEMSKIFKE